MGGQRTVYTSYEPLFVNYGSRLLYLQDSSGPVKRLGEFLVRVQRIRDHPRKIHQREKIREL